MTALAFVFVLIFVGPHGRHQIPSEPTRFATQNECESEADWRTADLRIGGPTGMYYYCQEERK